MAKAKRKQRKKAGRVIRIAPEVEKQLKQLKKDGESWSEALIRALDLAQDKQKKLLRLWCLPKSGLCAQDHASARGLAIMEAAKRGKRKVAEKPIRMREDK